MRGRKRIRKNAIRRVRDTAGDKHIYHGEKEFLNAVHPFDTSNKKLRRECTPTQKAIVYYMLNNGNKATIHELLNYILEKWEIIKEYSTYPLNITPNVRFVTQILSVRKGNRKYFLRSKEDPNLYFLHSRKRKPKQFKHENLSEDSKSEESLEQVTEKNDTDENDDKDVFLGVEELLISYGDIGFGVAIYYLLNHFNKPTTVHRMAQLTKSISDMFGPFMSFDHYERVELVLSFLFKKKFIGFTKPNIYFPLPDKNITDHQVHNAFKDIEDII